MHNVVTRLSATPGSLHRAAPALGEDTEAILAELDAAAAARSDGDVVDG